MTNKRARVLLIVGTLVFAVAFLGLTVDSLLALPGRTHEAALTDAVRNGKLAWQRHDCVGCHTILGNGAYFAPDLTKVAVTKGAAFVGAWLLAPGGQMPNQRLTNQEASDLVAFFDWVSKIDTNGWPPAAISVAAQTAPGGAAVDPQAAALFTSKGCAACHGAKGEGTAAAPPLGGVTARRDKAYLTAWLKDPQATLPGAKMPNLHLTDAEVTRLVAHLATFK